MWDFTISVDDLDLVDGMNRGRQTAMYTKDLIVYDNAEGEKVEHICEVVPDIGVSVFSCTFCVEAI